MLQYWAGPASPDGPESYIKYRSHKYGTSALEILVNIVSTLGFRSPWSPPRDSGHRGLHLEIPRSTKGRESINAYSTRSLMGKPSDGFGGSRLHSWDERLSGSFGIPLESNLVAYRERSKDMPDCLYILVHNISQGFSFFSDYISLRKQRGSQDILLCPSSPTTL